MAPRFQLPVVDAFRVLAACSLPVAAVAVQQIHTRGCLSTQFISAHRLGRISGLDSDQVLVRFVL